MNLSATFCNIDIYLFDQLLNHLIAHIWIVGSQYFLEVFSCYVSIIILIKEVE
jgi:hypothetical protein